jgi:nucleotide-binding universal stress UspA family protein
MFGRIVVGTDGSDSAGEAVRQATELASLSGAQLEIVSAFEPIPKRRIDAEAREAPGDVQYEIGPREDVNLILDAASGEAKKAGIAEVQTHAREGDPAEAILDVAEEIKADLIVVGNKGMTGARRFLLGSVPNNISHHAPCSVIIVKTT